MTKYIAYIIPMGAARMTQKGKWTSTAAQRYMAYKESIGYDLKTENPPTASACAVKMKFYMPIPDSWTEKKRKAAIGQPHTKKPDLDNLIKGIFDAANKIIWQDDNQVVECEAVKLYDDVPRIEIEVQEVKA